MDEPSEGSTVGVVGPGDGVREALSDAGFAVVDGDPDAVVAGSPDWVVAIGADSLAAVVAAGLECPVLPVAAGEGLPSVPRDRAAAAVRSVAAGEGTRDPRVLLSVALDGDRIATALFDVMLVTDEPARISEFGILSGPDPVAQFRADGTVVATPAGSADYASAAGGPRVFPETESLAIVPVAPFVTDADHWVVPDADVRVRVEREEPIALVVDGDRRLVVDAGAEVTVSRSGHLPVITTPESPPVHGRELEKH